jgi:5-methylcytosine-specific restriction endonuclease McrA
MSNNRPKLFPTKEEKRAAIDFLLSRDGCVCAICKNSLRFIDDLDDFFFFNKLSFDHILPRRLGGTDEIVNLQLAHGKCNVKRDRREISNGI